MEIKLLLTLNLREQAALQAALVTHGAPDSLVTLALTGACRISSVEEALQLRKWLAKRGLRVTPTSAPCMSLNAPGGFWRVIYS